MERDYYTNKEMSKMLAITREGLHYRYAHGILVKPVRITARCNIYPKRDFWNWAASQEAAHIIDPQTSTDFYRSEREKELIF